MKGISFLWKETRLGIAAATLAAGLIGCSDPSIKIAQDYIPERPDLSSFDKVLENHIARAENAIQDGQAPVARLMRLSRLYHANGFTNEAAITYEGLTQIEPENAVWFHRWATITAGSGYLEEALPLWEYVISLDPDYFPARVRLGDALLKLNRVEEAEIVFKEALDRSPEDPYALVGKARTFIARAEWETARGPLERAAEASDFRVGVDLLASVYRNLDQDYRATSLLRSTQFGGFVDIEDPWIDELNDDCYDPFRLATAGGIAEFRGDLNRGIELMQRAIELEPDKALHHFQIARMREARGELAQAETHFREAIRLQDDLADAYVYLIAILDQQGRPDEAESFLFRGYRKCQTSPSMRMEMAKYLEATGMRWKALEEVEEAIRLRPNEAGAYLLKARMLLEEQRVNDAVKTYEEALAAEPGNMVALSALTFNAIENGDRERASSYIEQVERHPRMPEKMVNNLLEKYSDAFEQAGS